MCASRGLSSIERAEQTIVAQLPEAASKLSARLTSLQIGQLVNMQKVQTAARDIEKATGQAESGTSPAKHPTHVVVDQTGFKLSNVLWVGSMGALGFMGEAAMVGFLVFFLLLSGDSFKRKLVRLTDRHCRTRDHGAIPMISAPIRANVHAVHDRLLVTLLN